MSNSKVSIIIPAYNCEEYLAETIDSVLAQTYQNWECIIVNDGSTDNTLSIVRKYTSFDNRFRCLSQENKGPSIARNNAIALSSGKYILPLDADDLISPSYIEKAVNYFEEHPDTKLVYCKADLFGIETGLWDLPIYRYNDFIWQNCIFCSAMYMRKDYDMTNGYSQNMIYGLEDWDFWLCLLSPEDKVYRINEVLFHYRIKHHSRNNENSTFHLKEMRKQIAINHKEIYGPWGIDVINQIIDITETTALLNQTLNELNKIKASMGYRLSIKITAPFCWLKNHILK